MKRQLLVLTAALLITATAMAQPGRGGNYRMSGRGMAAGQTMGKNMAQGCTMLNLTEDQQKKVEAMHIAHLKEMQPLRDQIRTESVKLQTLKTANKIDSGAINKLIDSIGKLRITMAKKHETHRQAFRKILTEDQIVIFNSRSGGRRGHGKGGTMGRSGRGGRRGRH